MTAYALSDKTIETIRTARHNSESGWRIIAKMFDAEQKIETDCAREQGRKPAPKMLIYQAVAYAAGYKVPTVRAWVRYNSWAGDVLDEIQPAGESLVTIEHLRLAEREAKQRGEQPDIALIRRIKAADKRGAAIIPPDAWAAELKPQKDDGLTPLAAALERCKRNLDAASRNAATALSEAAKLNGGQGFIRPSRVKALCAGIESAQSMVDAMIGDGE